MEPKLNGLELIRLTSPDAFIRASFHADEGLARIEVHGDTVVGSMYDFGEEDEDEDRDEWAEIRLIPPFENRCTCRKGGGCKHVATVALTHLYREMKARRKANDPIPVEERAVYDMPFLVEEPLRLLAVALVGAFPKGASLVAELMAERRKTVSYYEDHIWK